MAAILARPAAGEEVRVTETGNSSMKVVVRVRPESEAELRSSCHCVVKVVDEHVLTFDPAEHQGEGKEHDRGGISRLFGGRKLRPLLAKKHKDLRFAFDHVFDETSSQLEVFRRTTEAIIDGVLDGINCSVFAYGATGAGKTHTMLGSADAPGVIFLTMMELYRRMDALKDSKTCAVSISYCEVYNETIQDLLISSGPLNLREDAQNGLSVSGLSYHTPNNAVDLLSMLERGNGNRTQHSTEANATSSRSHAVFQVMVEQRARTAGLSMEVMQAKMSLIDLAGSERATVTSNRGARLREGANINRSLLALGNCINALASNKGKSGGYIPYRDSKLTRLLKDSLGGNCRTVMVANISPSALCYEDTYNTLKYADRAKQIKIALVRNVLHVDYHLSNYKIIIEDLRNEISELKCKVAGAAPLKPTYDLKETNRLCEMVGSVYGERGRLRKQMADLDAKERETLLKVFRKERDLGRIDLLWSSDVKRSKILTRLSALRKHLADIQRQKQTINEYLYSNNESVGRIQGEVNNTCGQQELAGGVLQQVVDAVMETKKLEVENGYQWKQTKHLLKYIKNQEREIARTERLLTLSLSLVHRQHTLLQRVGVDLSPLQEDLSCLAGLAQGDKGVAWADQTRIMSTNDLRDVSTSNLSTTQQQLFDCFLEHSSPCNNIRKIVPPRIGGPYSPHLGILTRPNASKYNSISNLCEERTARLVDGGAPRNELEELTMADPSSQVAGASDNDTLRGSHALTSSYHFTSLPSSTTSSSSSLATSSLSRSPSLSSCFSERDDVSEVSLGSLVNSDPMQDQEELDNFKLENKSMRSRDLAKMTLTSSASRFQWHKQQPYDSRCLFPSKNVRTPYFPIGNTTPTDQKRNTCSAPSIGMHVTTPTGMQTPPSNRTESVTPTPVPQPYSMFQPLRPPPRPTKATPTSLSSQQSISTDSGLGSITGGATAGQLRRAPLMPRHRPNANGYMVRSSGNSLASTSSMYSRCNEFEDNFTLPPRPSSSSSLQQEEQPSHISQSTPKLTNQSYLHVNTAQPTKIPVGTLTSTFNKPTPVRATPNPYVRDPSGRPCSLTSTSLGCSPYGSSEYIYPFATPTRTPPSLLKPPTNYSPNRGCGEMPSSILRHQNKPSDHKRLVKRVSISDSLTSLSDVGVARDSLANNSICRNQQVGVAKDSSSSGSHRGGSVSEGLPKGQGRGMFSRSKTNSKLPSYLKMTKATESKMVSRVVHNKENSCQQPVHGSHNGQLRLKKFPLNRSRDHLNSISTTSGGSISLSSKFNSAPQLAC